MLAEVVRSTSGNAGPVVLFCDAEDSEAHPGIVASFFGVSEIPYSLRFCAHHPNPKGAGWWAQKPVSPAGSLLAGGRLRRAFRRTPPGAPCRAGVCRRPGALRHCPPVVGSAAINASLAAGHPRGMLHGLRPTSPGDARSVGSFQAVKWLSRHILARKRAAVFHGPLDSLPSANTNSLESHDQIPVCWYWGAGGEALQ